MNTVKKFVLVKSVSNYSVLVTVFIVGTVEMQVPQLGPGDKPHIGGPVYMVRPVYMV